MATIALLGSGEFLPWARAVDGWCAARVTSQSDRALIVPTASAPEGDAVFARWGDMGIEHYRAMGLRPEVLPLRVREDASDPAIVDAVADARIAFFSGGNPGYLAETLDGTPFWDAVSAAVRANVTALGGCSAGAVFLGAMAPFVANDALRRWVPGLGLLPRAFVLPHFDVLNTYAAGLRDAFLSARPDGAVAIGIDEETAMMGDGTHWRVAGAGKTWVGTSPDGLTEYAQDSEFELALGLE